MAKDADGFETSLKIDMAGEIFSCSGIEVVEPNFLDVYIFDKWCEKDLPAFVEGEKITPNI